MDDERLPLVPIQDAVLAVRERPRVVARVLAMASVGLALRGLVVLAMWQEGRGGVTSLIAAMGLVPPALIGASVPLGSFSTDPDLRAAASVWRWIEASVAGTTAHFVLFVLVLRAIAVALPF